MNEPITVNTLIEAGQSIHAKREAFRQSVVEVRTEQFYAYVLAEIDRANAPFRPGYPVSLWRPKK